MVKIVSLNIERDKHLDLALQFLQQVLPDVFCVQEIFEEDVSTFKTLFPNCVFAPMTRTARGRERLEKGDSVFGVAIFSSVPIVQHETSFYVGNGLITEANGANMETKEKTIQHPLLVCDIEESGKTYRVATTHFPWTSDGSASDFQRQALEKLLGILQDQGELVFCGDFNAPRGGEIFAALARQFKDNVPPQYTSSIDGSLHRAGPLPHMVDGLFSTASYHVSDVRMVCGVSDHCALIGNIQKYPASVGVFS